jgi:hypothetical protein
MMELRQRIKAEPITDLSQFYSNLFKIPEIVAQAEAQAQANLASAGNGQGSADAVKNQNQPTNQHGTKPGPSRAKNSMGESIYDDVPGSKSYLEYFQKQYGHLREDVVSQAKLYIKNSANQSNPEEFSKTIGLSLSLAKDNIKKQGQKALLGSMVAGTEQARMKLDPFKMPTLDYTSALVRLENTLNGNIDRLFKDIETLSIKAIESMSEVEAVSKINAALDSVQFRMSFIVRTDLSKAYNYGIAICAKSFGKESVKVATTCETCKANYPESFDLTKEFYDIIPPALHPNCDCRLEIE